MERWKIIERLIEQFSFIKGINLTENFGQHNATLCGLREACGEILITMDVDLQHSPKDIPKLVAAVEGGRRLVYGKYDHKRHGGLQNLGSWIFNRVLCDITGNKESITSFRAFDKSVIEHISNFDNPRVILDIMFSQVVGPSDIEHVVISHGEDDGESTYTFWKLVQFALDMLFNYSTVPLRIASVLGILLSSMSFLIGVLYLVLYLSGKITVPGFTTTILAVSFLSGIILFTQGIFGEYLGRMFLIETRRPQYRIAKVIGGIKGSKK